MGEIRSVGTGENTSMPSSGAQENGDICYVFMCIFHHMIVFI